MPNLLIQFCYLQALDILSTLAFHAIGVHEANPVVKMLFGATQSPLAALLTVKLLALGLAFYCWRSRRAGLLSRVNLFYAVLVAWNLLAFVLGAAGSAAA